MTTYIEYKVKLTDGQKSKLVSAIRNKSPLTLRLKHSHLRGSDELMLNQRQINKIKKSIANGTGSDIKISKTQIRSSVKHGGNLFSSLASLGAKVLPYAIHDGRLLGLFLPQLRKCHFLVTEQYFIFQMKQDIKTS